MAREVRFWSVPLKAVRAAMSAPNEPPLMGGSELASLHQYLENGWSIVGTLLISGRTVLFTLERESSDLLESLDTLRI